MNRDSDRPLGNRIVKCTGKELDGKTGLKIHVKLMIDDVHSAHVTCPRLVISSQY